MNKPTCECPEGFYDNKVNAKCDKCEPKCSSCKENATNCTKCGAGRENPPECVVADGNFED